MKQIIIGVLLVLLLLCLVALFALPKLLPGSNANLNTPSTSTTQPSGSNPTDPADPTDPPASSTTKPSSGTQPSNPAHSCAPESADYLVDLSNHWQLCSCGKTVNAAAHDLENSVCALCGAEIYTDEHTGQGHLLMYNEFADPILELTYGTDGQLLTTETYAYSYSSLGLPMSKKHYINGSLALELTWDVFGNMLSQREYDENGLLTYSLIYELQYDDSGNILSVRHITNDVLTYAATYEKNANGKPWLKQDAYYLENGSYSVTTYDESGSILTYICYDANGNPLDYSGRFDTDACAPLFATWTGTVTIHGSKLSMIDVDAMLLSTVTMTLDENGNITVTLDLDAENYRQALKASTLEGILTLYAEEMTRAEIEAYFQTQYGMGLEAYVNTTVDAMDLSDQLHQVWQGVYFAEDNLLYFGDSWVTFMDSCEIALQDDHLIFLEEGSEAATAFTKRSE